MSQKRKTKRKICFAHDEIIKLASDLQIELEGDVAKKIIQKLKKIEAVAEEAKEYGQSMEDRLSEYREAIEGLGFYRRKKRK